MPNPSRKRKRNQGRRYEEDEWVEFVADGMADRSVRITSDLRDAADTFEGEVDEALDKCFKKFPPAEDPSDLYGDPGTAADIYFTLSGAGVGIWDGRWDEYYPDAKERHWQRVKACLNDHLAEPYAKLESELMDAAYAEDNPSTRRVRNLARRVANP